MQQMLEGFLAHLRGPPSVQDDLISTSGEGSNIADEEDWDHDSNHCHGNLTGFEKGNDILWFILYLKIIKVLKRSRDEQES